jgi:hypothetical protein
MTSIMHYADELYIYAGTSIAVYSMTGNTPSGGANYNSPY